MQEQQACPPHAKPAGCLPSQAAVLQCPGFIMPPARKPTQLHSSPPPEPVLLPGLHTSKLMLREFVSLHADLSICLSCA